MSILIIGITEAMGLAAVALIGYVFGRRTRSKLDAAKSHPEIERAAQIAGRLERIAESLRQALASHHAQVLHFKRKLRQARELQGDDSWQAMCLEAESVLAPTVALTSQLSQAYDELRKQSLALASFTVGRVDSATGIATARAFDEQVAFHLRCQQTNQHAFSVAMITLDLPSIDLASRTETVRSLQNVAHLLQSAVRGHDFVARYGTEEFAVLLANTRMQGSNQFAARIRKLVSDQVGLTLSIGLAESTAADDVKSLMARADSALYSARAGGGDQQFSHTGEAIVRPHEEGHTDRTASFPSVSQSNGKLRSEEEVEDSLDELADVLVEAGA